MVAPKRKSLSRGASILSALVFVGLLSGVVAGVQYLSPYTHSESQTAAPVPATTKDEKKKECNPGEVNAVSVQGGKVTSPDVKPIQCWDVKTDPAKPKRLSNQKLCADFDDPNDCRVAACVAKDGKTNCQIVGEFDSTDPTAKAAFDKVMKSGDLKDVLNAMKENGNLDGFKSLVGNMDAQTQKALSDAFSEPIKEAQSEFDKVVGNQKSISDKILELEKNCESKGIGSADCGKDAELQALKAKEKELAEQRRVLGEQLSVLKDAQIAVKPPQECPSGTTGTPPNCTKDTSGCGSNCGPGNGTTGFGGAASGLGSLLQGLAKGLGTSPAAPATPPQACQTDPNAYAQQQQQYQYALQQYNYQLQLYNQQQQQASIYGTPAPVPPAQPTPCTPSTGNQCQAQPQQPAASACAAGSWRATYTGACVTGWQCISTEGPKAELSCEPKVADVGMTLAITYGCSSGVASSSSFKVTTQPGGSATTTVADPPAGTNTATYTLACTDNGKTTGAQCAIQVARANIILVANPKTVPANGTSLLSWLTTGMQSCIISSPDQADFTARNSSNTSVTGAATTSAIATSAQFLLHCETVSGGTKDATTTISVAQ